MTLFLLFLISKVNEKENELTNAHRYINSLKEEHDLKLKELKEKHSKELDAIQVKIKIKIKKTRALFDLNEEQPGSFALKKESTIGLDSRLWVRLKDDLIMLAYD